MMLNRTRAAEIVGQNHPDKQADRYSDEVLSFLLERAKQAGFPPSSIRCAAEVMINGKKIFVGGEYAAPPGIFNENLLTERLQKTYVTLGNDYSDDLSINFFIRPQASEIAMMTDESAAGAGDQGVMQGFATTDTKSMLPRETELARDLILTLHRKVQDGTLGWGREDTKSQVCLDTDDKVLSVVMSVQHRAFVSLEEVRSDLFNHVVVPVMGDIDPNLCKLNQKGTFIEGGADADCGLTGRKIVVDAYGPSVQVGGGAFSGKDPTKVDRSAAYAARQIAKTVLEKHPGGGRSCNVTIAYGIGQLQPEILSAIIDGQHDVSDWVAKRFSDNSPKAIQDRLGLWDPKGWSYTDTAAFGHFGRDIFPWERTL